MKRKIYLIAIISVFSLLFINSCIEDPNAEFFSPSISLNTPSVLQNSIVLSATIETSSAVVSEVGFIYGRDENLSEAKKVKATVSGKICTSSISDFTDGTYYYRAYAKNGDYMLNTVVESFQVDGLLKEKSALMAIYNATGGTNWVDNTNWGSDKPLGEWYGVTTNANGNVVSITLYTNNLQGKIPSDIGFLEYLEILGLGNDASEEKTNHNNISSIGIENNRNLKEISATRIGLESINIANNEYLTFLALGGNKISNLNITNQSKLDTLYCWGNNLTSLNTSYNPKLLLLDCGSQNITSLDFSNNNLLQYIDCRNSQLSSLSLSNLTNLSELYCLYNELTSIDVSKNKKLLLFDFHDNKIKNIDFSSNKDLLGFSCADNAIKSLDLSHNPKLQQLLCAGNDISSLDLSTLPNITRLSCSENRIATLDITPILNLKDFWCGAQKDGIVIKLKMTEAQRDLWKTKWSTEENNKDVLARSIVKSVGNNEDMGHNDKYEW